MNRVKFEVDRIKNEMARMKSEYFELREASEKEVLNERNFAQEMANMQNEKPALADINISTLKKWYDSICFNKHHIISSSW